MEPQRHHVRAWVVGRGDTRLGVVGQDDQAVGDERQEVNEHVARYDSQALCGGGGGDES
eukprot:SAG31_NODE_11001_length_1074_cov_1.618462_2_plen_59_part_00